MKTSKKVLAALLAICLNTGTALAEVDKTATTALVADVTYDYGAGNCCIVEEYGRVRYLYGYNPGKSQRQRWQ